MKFLFLVTIIFQSLGAMAMDPPLDVTMPSRLQRLLKHSAIYLSDDPLNLQEAARRDGWRHFYRYFREFSQRLHKYDELHKAKTIPENRKYRGFSHGEYLNHCLSLGEEHEGDLFRKRYVDPLRIAKANENDNAFVMNCINLNLEAFSEIVENKIKFTSEDLKKWEDVSYMWPYKSKRIDGEKDESIKDEKQDLTPAKFERALMPPTTVNRKRVVRFDDENIMLSTDRKNDMPLQSPKKKKRKKWDCTGILH